MNEMIAASPWVLRWQGILPASGRVLDLACGGGRHARLLAAQGRSVLAVDRDAEALAGLACIAGVETLQADLEGEPWPPALTGQRFSGIVVTNYLWRPGLALLAGLLAPGGVVIYETFMLGNERYGRPSNPDFLLKPQELLDWARAAGLRVLGYEEGYADMPKPCLRQAICAVREGGAQA